jgi:uncharacterized lipoprotein YddW (UPF0748 family)
MKKKNLLSLLLAAILLLSACGGVSDTPETPFMRPQWESVVPDETVTDFFDIIHTVERQVDERNQHRGVHQLIYYTRMQGETTGTNEYGVEAVVVDGRVIRHGYNNSIIPDDGFVISGNDSHAIFILENMLPGALVSFDSGTYIMTVSYDKQAYLSGALHLYRTCRDMLERWRNDHPNHADAEEALGVMSGFIDVIRKSTDGGEIKANYEQVWQMYEDTYYICMPSPEGEIRAVWHNLWGIQNKEQIRSDMEGFAAGGFNVLFLDVFAIGYLIYRSEYAPLLPQADVDFDVLQEFIDVGNELGIEIHACVNNFLIGVYGPTEGTSISGAYLADWHPEFITTYKDGTHRAEIEEGGIMLNPAHPGARQLLLNIYTEIVDNYPDIGGINLDFIRYFPYTSVDDCMGMDAFSRQRVLDELGIDIHEITSIHSDEWLQFRAWRAENVSTFVQSVREMFDERNQTRDRPLRLSTCSVGRPERAYNDRSQDWPRFLREGWIDFIAPMSYFQYSGPIYDEIANMIDTVPGSVIVVGIAPINDRLPRLQWLKQIQASRDAGAKGIAFFSSWSMNTRTHRFLGEGPFRVKGLPRYEWEF